MQFPFTPTSSDKINAFLSDCAAYLAGLEASPLARCRFLERALIVAMQAPTSSFESAFAKSSAILTLQNWLEDVTEAA